MDWATVIGVILGSQVTLEVVKRITSYITKRLDEKKSYKDALQNNLSDIKDVYVNLEKIVSKTSASRASVFKITNGGGTPQITKNMYLTCLYQKNYDRFTNLEELVREFKIDECIVDYAKPISIKKNHHIHLINLIDGYIKDVLESDEVAESVFYQIYKEKNILIFVQLDYKKGNCTDYNSCATSDISDISKRLLIAKTVNDLSNLFRKNITLVENSRCN